ncbi:MAG TPA: ACT domain-containing protein [Acidimicrobiia bacterium]|nr:ACT domain-containing protein [Acidimicrobiia bacterium]
MLRAARDRLVGDRARRGAAFGRALSELLDGTLSRALVGAAHDAADGRLTLVAVGSYGRAELCPGSDVDAVLVHDGRDVAQVAERLWYPLWDAGFVLGHATNTVKEQVALAERDLHALTAMLDARLVAGDPAPFRDLVDRIRGLAVRRRRRLVDDLRSAADGRREKFGFVAEVLEPNLKEAAGGLRDLQSLSWAGWTLGEPGGLRALVDRGYLRPADPASLAVANARLLDARVALQRVTGSRSDVLSLQEQDAVAPETGAADADALVRELAAAGRTVSWLASDVFARLQDTERGPGGRRSRRDRDLGDGVVLRDGRVAFSVDAHLDGKLVLRAAAAAAGLRAPFDRGSLERAQGIADVAWDAETRDAFVSLLRAGRGAVPAFEALDQAGALTRLLPEWDHVRSLPQRNAYHRFTVDRHLLEAVAECAALLDDDGFEGDVARRARADLLLLAALLHDIGKGTDGDHSVVGAEAAVRLARRIGVDEPGVATLDWLVRHHLALAETATRRDLSEETTITRFGRLVGTSDRLDLLYALTVGDSRATGPAAWGPTKAALVRELFVKTDSLLELGVVGAGLEAHRRDTLERHSALLAGRDVAIDWSERDDGLLECAVAAPDRTGLLASVAGVLALFGFDIRDAAGYITDGMALEVFDGADRFGRLAEPEGREAVATVLVAALGGELPLAEQLRARIRRYRIPDPGDVTIVVDQDASPSATVVEVHAPDHVGLLARVASTFADLGVDVRTAKVSTLGERVVDVFYVHDAAGNKITRQLTIDQLKATLLARLTSEYWLPEPA